MALELYMAGVIPRNLDTSLEFYQRLGLALPERREGQQHYHVKMDSGITFFLNTLMRGEAKDNSRVIFEFYLPNRAAVDEKHADLTGAGYQSERVPAFEPAINVYFALINDPDGHVIMLSAD